MIAERGDPPPDHNETEKRSSILLVEDEVLIRMAVSDQLRGAGYPVIEAANAHEALEVLRHAQDVKLVISDVRMPGSIDGVELARRVRSEFPAVKVMLTSGHLSVVNGVEHDGFFSKPYNISAMIRHIKKLIA